jgi:hypothetical protein
VTPAREASAIFRRGAVYEEPRPETKRGGDRKSDQVANLASRFNGSTAEATGKPERPIHRAAMRREALGDDLGAVTGTSLDEGVARA